MTEILMPVYIGLILAYLLSPIMSLIDRKLLVRLKKSGVKRAAALALTLLAVLLLFTVIALLIFPQVYVSFIDLTSKLSGYIRETAAYLDQILPHLDGYASELEKYISFEKTAAKAQEIILGIPGFLSEKLPEAVDYFSGIASGFLNILLGVFFAVYFLASKERLLAQLKKVLRALCADRVYDGALRLAAFTHKTFGGYITGKLLDSGIVGLLCFIVCSICGIPYALLVSVIIAICNVIPLAGPIIGAVPGVFIVFIVDPLKALWFVVIIVVIMQLDGNVIEPKVLGEATGLDSIWVLFSITLMGGIFGIIGMIIAVPIFALIYAVVKALIELRLTARGLPSSTSSYL